jgi:hypothetical protein
VPLEEVIVNKVANSGIVSLDLETLYHSGARVILDIKDTLFMGMILKEKDFRAWVGEHNWQQYSGQNVAITCSANAIIPTWAYMLIAAKLTPIANHIVFGDLAVLEASLFQKAITQLNLNDFIDKRVVIKGCGDVQIPESAFVEASRILLPVVKSLMYGEPCSTVPVYKKP